MDRSASSPAPARPPAETNLGIVDALAQLSFLISGMLARRASSHDLSMIQTRLLGVLRDREPGMHELARMLELDKSSVSGLVDRAERRGLVKRTVSADDRRSFRVSLTKRGQKLAHQVVAEFQAEVHLTLKCLSPTEQSVLSGLASRMVFGHNAAQGVLSLSEINAGQGSEP